MNAQAKDKYGDFRGMTNRQIDAALDEIHTEEIAAAEAEEANRIRDRSRCRDCGLDHRTGDSDCRFYEPYTLLEKDES